MPSAPTIDDAVLEAYGQKGYVVCQGVVSGQELELLARAYEHIRGDSDHSMRCEWDAGGRLSLEKFEAPEKAFPELRGSPIHGWAAAVASRLLAVSPERISIVGMFLNKPANAAGTDWHQHSTQNRPPEITDSVTLWTPLDEVEPQNGCLQFIPGSHREEPIAHPPQRNIDQADIDADRIALCPMSPGEVVVIHDNVIHGGTGNRSSQARCCYALYCCLQSSEWAKT